MRSIATVLAFWHLVKGSLCSGGLTEVATNSCSSSRNCISCCRSSGSSCRFSYSSEALQQNQHCKSLPSKSKTEFWCNFSSGKSRARPEMTPIEKSPSRRGCRHACAISDSRRPAVSRSRHVEPRVRAIRLSLSRTNGSASILLARFVILPKCSR